ncbi:E3 ubiquitin/ISG15 ligase TRIM25-like [Anomaloglossus baeobatrachus]|uniref:E3 ubiquitin/ISG15 ligase TRIM25-like n=1 Tax=Anomaloglossus baeobatrachus TaxID=238106 RepID=UPI003F507E4C
MASAALRKELLCSICLSLYTDPVTLRCGHSFCRECIETFINIQDRSRVYSCPSCRRRLQERPALKRNIALCNVVENIRSTQPHQKITGIRCTYCIHSPVPAVRSCLHCEASLCDDHLKVHSKGPEHVLTDPSTSLEKWKCSVHKELLRYYCTKDAACICVSCSLAGEHQGHQVEMLDEASEKKKKKLRNVLKKLMTKRKKTEEKVQSLEEHRRKTQEKASGEAERVTVYFIDVRRRVDDLEKKILSEISRWKELTSLSLLDVIQKLKTKKDELSRKMRHIEELCNMTDPLTVLQEPNTGDLCDPEEDGGDEDTGGHDGGHENKRGCDEGDEDTGGHDGGDEDTGGHDGGDEDTGGHDGGDEDTGGHDGGDEDTGGHDGGDEDTWGHDGGDEDTGGHDGGDEDTGGHDGGDEDTGGHYGGDRGAELISHISHTLSAMIRDINVTLYGVGPADILLDVNTAHNNLLISDDLKTATWSEITQNRPETAERFQSYPQVMSGRGFTSGRHYWDVEIRGSALWMVGMCYPSIDRSGDQSVIGDNNKSWCLDGPCLKHDNKYTWLPQQISSDGVRICLDYEAGQLSFYALCDPIRHLHSFTAAFSEPLHAVLYVWEGSIKFSGAAVRSRKRRRIRLETEDLIA